MFATVSFGSCPRLFTEACTPEAVMVSSGGLTTRWSRPDQPGVWLAFDSILGLTRRLSSMPLCPSPEELRECDTLSDSSIVLHSRNAMITSPQSRRCRKPSFLTLLYVCNPLQIHYPQSTVPKSVPQSTSHFLKYAMSFGTLYPNAHRLCSRLDARPNSQPAK
jgi:hypothetical protein